MDNTILTNYSKLNHRHAKSSSLRGCSVKILKNFYVSAAGEKKIFLGKNLFEKDKIKNFKKFFPQKWGKKYEKYDM